MAILKSPLARSTKQLPELSATATPSEVFTLWRAKVKRQTVKLLVFHI